MVIVEQLERKRTNDSIIITFRLGRTAFENHMLIDDADGNDWWFHLADEPSGHCIVEINDNSKLDKDDIIYASTLIKEYSKFKNINKKLKVNYLQIKNIKKGKKRGEAILLTKPNIIFV